MRADRPIAQLRERIVTARRSADIQPFEVMEVMARALEARGRRIWRIAAYVRTTRPPASCALPIRAHMPISRTA
jgi:hypothetical protein